MLLVQIDPVEEIWVRFQQQKTKRQYFELQDDTDSIDIFMWDKTTEQCEGLSEGDVIKVTNMKTSDYYRNISLNSTGSTRIHKVLAVISTVSRVCC